MTTSRNRQDFSGMSPTYSHHSYVVGENPPVNITVQRSWQGTKKVCRDNLNPFYYARRKAGEVIMSDCSMMTETRSYTGANVTLDDPGQMTDSGTGDLAWIVEAGVGQIANAASETAARLVLVKAYAKMNESGIMTGEILKDLDQTLHMLRSPMKSAVDLLSNITKSKARRLRNPSTTPARATANAWLEYRYGWRPLMMDTEKVFDHFQEKVRKYERRYLVARSGLTFRDSRSGSVGPEEPPYGVSSLQGSYGSSETVKYSAGVVYTKNVFDDTDALMELLGLRPRDLPSTAWECIPYSFVADWFINVGDWLQALIPVPGVSPLGNWVSITTDKSVSCSGGYVYRGESSRGHYTGSLGGSTCTWKQFDRTTNLVLPDLPVLKRNPLSRLNQADALALLTKPMSGLLKGLRH